MATILTSPHRLKDGEPTGFSKKIDVELQLQYRINGNGDYVWSYRSSTVTNHSEKFMAAAAEFSDWSEFMEQDVFETSLDIAIDGDTLIQVDTVGAGLFWSLQKDAVMTLDDHSRTYGELRYWNGSQWEKRENFNGQSCQRIRFKALHHVHGTPTGHKFSYNVRLRNAAGVIVEHEIDPDLQNPRT